ncbi:MAG TPA: PEP-CTERM sorting domain-containing protein [Gemmatirosa sp.]
MRVRRFLTAGVGALCVSVLGAGTASAQLLNTGVGSFTSSNAAGEGLGEGVDVSTATTLSQIGFYLGLPNAGTSVKYLIYDVTANALVYSETKVFAAVAADNTLELSDPFSYALLPGRTYYFGVVANSALDVSYNYVAGTPLSANGLTLNDPNILFSDFGAPTTDLSTAGSSIALQLYGAQASTVPEPGSLLLLSFGLTGAGVVARRTRMIAFRRTA